MKDVIVSLLSKNVKLNKEEIERLIEIPPNGEMGDYAFPCFSLAKIEKKNPVEIAKSIAEKTKSKDFERIEAKGPYVNFFVNRKNLAEETLGEILKEEDKYGSSNSGKGKTIVIDMSSPNIAKPFGIGHLRSTIIGNSIANTSMFLGYKVVKINYLGDWGTPFGKIILGYNKFGNEKKLKENPIKHLYELYVKISSDDKYEDEAREWFRKLETGDKEAEKLWKKFKALSIEDFDKIYSLLGIKFDVISSESEYNGKMDATIKELKEKKLLEKSEGALIVDLEKYALGKCLIQKSDGATLYATRDITAAIDRYKKYKFSRMFYDVGQEQTLHFKQVFKVLELLGYKFGKECRHIPHGLYLGSEGKKLATRKGTTIFMEDVLGETIELAKKEITQREKLSGKALGERAKAIAIAAIFYGDLKNNRVNDVIFDVQKFLSFEGDTGPYLLYSYARAKSILRKAEYKKSKLAIIELNDDEKNIINELSKFKSVVESAYENLSPNIIANYAFQLSQSFNEFYHKNKVIGDKNEKLRLILVDCFSIVLKNAISLLGIRVIEKM